MGTPAAAAGVVQVAVLGFGGWWGSGIPWGETSAPLGHVLEMPCPLFVCPWGTEDFQHKPALTNPHCWGWWQRHFVPARAAQPHSCSHSSTTAHDPSFGTGVCCGGSWDHPHTESSCQFEEELVARVACPWCPCGTPWGMSPLPSPPGHLDSCKEDPQLLQTHGCNRLQPLPNSSEKYSGICLLGFKWVNYLNFSTPR